MFDKLFTSHEVKQTCVEIDRFVQAHAGGCENVVRAETMRLAKDKKKTVYSIKNEGLSADHLALILITNVLGRHLSSGQYHTYRGVLSGVGKDMLALWTSAVSALEERGYYSAEEARKDMRWIESEVRKAG